MAARLLAASLVLACGCGTDVQQDPGLEALSISKVAPDTIVPGTKLVVKGASFVDTQWGAARLRLKGSAGGSSIDEAWPATFVDFSTLNVAVDADMIEDLGGDVDFSGSATVEIVATSDGETYASKSLSVDLTFREALAPAPTSVQSGGVIFVNDRIEVEGDGFLLGGDEGETVAKITGCFTLDSGGGCAPITEIEIPMTPEDPFERTKATFPFSPKVAGIKPGTFNGEITIINKQTTQAPSSADAVPVTYDMVTSQLFSLCVGDPCTGQVAASLGQYVFVQGGGFVGGEPGALTELELAGTFTLTGSNPAPVTMTLIPEYVEGRLVRYILNTDDALGTALDLREDTGSFTGTITPVISYGPDTVRGVAMSTTLSIAPVKQVVYLDFRPSYVEGLRDFGLRAVDNKLRQRILEVCRSTYRGVNIDFRTEPPTDFALYAHVELTGVDPNNQGLFGYDNSPGKDNGNVRLYDRLGGVNALTQQDGYAGYGGVFLRSLMGFSKHPGSFTRSVPGADVIFDQLFDPFRPDIGGEPIRAADLSGDIPQLSEGSSCPASDREGRIACAIYVLGNLIGGTLAHEIGHSLGLANPFAEGFHNAGDLPNRLMDGGGDRSFLERAVLMGQGPAQFCDDEYTYLRMILPSSDPAPSVDRPGCF
ncbi:MAG TPA: hypothetical protein VM513_24175 [Kofleriaceae bacterium]|jgi:hypothetical protein|nr:hypothetical protein [Kofleriaceae bacterium]